LSPLSYSPICFQLRRWPSTLEKIETTICLLTFPCYL
jgi:hypothetical protein